MSTLIMTTQSATDVSAPVPAVTARLRAGDHAALDDLIDRHYTPCVRMAERFSGRDRAFAEDAVQDAFLRMATQPPRLSDDLHAERWLRAAVRSACIDRLRSEARRRNRETQSFAGVRDDNKSPSINANGWLDHDTLDRLRQAIAALTPDERDLLARRFARGRGTTALAMDLGINRETLRGRLSRTLDRLSQTLRREP